MGFINYIWQKIKPQKQGLFTNNELEKFIKKVEINSTDLRPDKKDWKTINEFAKITMQRMGLEHEPEPEKPASYYLEKHKRKKGKI
jgi:hypothetical protein